MARVTAPNGEQLPETDNPGLLAFYERRGYKLAAKRARGKAKDTAPADTGDQEPNDDPSEPEQGDDASADGE